ncbi:5-formyltetrahydrofolate cyclo-ligase [Aquifex sp.]
MTKEKNRVRRELLQKRINLSEEERERLSQKILRNLKSLPEYRKAKKVLLYCPIKGEPDLTPLFEEVIREKELILPKVNGEELKLYKVESPSCLSPGAFGILEPMQGEEVDPEELDFIAVPGIAFDLRGYRLGFGKGYYDRLLKRTKATKVGVAYSFQVLERVPHDAWDVPVDIILTEKFVRRLRNGLV